jgi:hypothetical protein
MYIASYFVVARRGSQFRRLYTVDLALGISIHGYISNRMKASKHSSTYRAPT